MIIFINGKAGSGKDTFGIMLGHVLHYITNPNKANYHPNINNFMNIVERIDNGDDVKSIFNSIYFTALAEPLKDSQYFGNVAILRNGRSFGWDNGYDCCADWAYSV